MTEKIIKNDYYSGSAKHFGFSGSYFFIFLFFMFLLPFLSSTTIVDSSVNPFENSTNVTNCTNCTNETVVYNYTYLENKTIELINALLDAKNLNAEERAYLESLLESNTEERRQFQEALAKLNYAYEDAIEQRDNAIQEKDDFENKTKVKLETLETEVESLRLDNVKTKAYGFAWIFLGLLVGIFTIEIAYYLKKNQHGYFVLRWIRDRIPIKI